MPNTFGFGTDTTGFSSTTHDHILKEVVATLRAGLVSMPRGAVVPAVIVAQRGENFVLRSTAYPDLVDTASTDPLSEGVAPSALKLGIDTMDWSVTQSGGRTVITDLAQLQSPHDLKTIAADKIARLAADKVDAIGRAALAAGAADLGDSFAALDTDTLLDVVANLQNRDVEPVPGIGFYCLLHPYALRGLTGESDLNGYVDVTAQAAAGNLTSGAVGQYRGITFLTSTKFEATAGQYPVYMFGANSIAAGDVSTMEFIHWQDAGVGNELRQLAGVGYKAILGAKVMDFSEETDGAGTNASTVARAVQFTVQSGVSNTLG